MTWEDALSLLDEMPDDFLEHEAAMAIRSKVIKVLTAEVEEHVKQIKEDGAGPDEAAAAAVLRTKLIKALVGMIDELGPRKMKGEAAEELKKEALRQAGEALGMALRQVDGLFGESTTKVGFACLSMSAFYTVLTLRADIKNLSPGVMKVQLGSEALQLRSENDAYYFLCAWLSQTPRLSNEKERRALYEQLLPLLRFHNMSLDFVGVVVSACPYAGAPGLLPYILSRSTTLRTIPVISQKKKA